ncbi:hypothetical protein ACHAXS_001641 [Conticribra weissflogii]
MKCMLPSIILLLLRISSARKAPFLASHSAPSLLPPKQILHVRGGAMEPKLMTDTMTVAAICQGLIAMEAPEVNLKIYGTKDDSFETQDMSRVMGAGILCIGIMAFCLFTQNMEVTDAIGWSNLVWIFYHARCLINQDHETYGYDPTSISVWLAVNIIGVHACFTGASYGSAFAKTAFSVWALNCVLAVIAPKTAAKLYSNCPDEVELNEEQVYWTRGYGYENLAHCVLTLSLLNGVDAHRTMGFMSIPVIAHTAHLLLLGSDVLNMLGSVLVSIWLVFHGVNFATLAY